MAKINGTLYLTTIDGVALAYSQSAELSINQELFDTTTKSSSGWAEHGNGLRDWTISVEGLVDFSASANVVTLNGMIANRSQATVVFTDSATGDRKWTGTASLASLTISAPMEEAVSWSGELTGTGALAMATI